VKRDVLFIRFRLNTPKLVETPWRSRSFGVGEDRKFRLNEAAGMKGKVNRAEARQSEGGLCGWF
jgi:hypothetical protein